MSVTMTMRMVIGIVVVMRAAVNVIVLKIILIKNIIFYPMITKNGPIGPLRFFFIFMSKRSVPVFLYIN